MNARIFLKSFLYLIVILMVCAWCTACRFMDPALSESMSTDPNEYHVQIEVKDVQEQFTMTEDGLLVDPNGVAYKFLANEGILYFFGDLVKEGTVFDEENDSKWGYSYTPGVYSIKGDEIRNILIRKPADSEWFAIYRRADLPELDYSIDQCIRLEMIPNSYFRRDRSHISCGGGITDKTEIANFLSEVRSQQGPREAGLYDMITKPDGFLDNCYYHSTIYGFFAEEPNIAVPMSIDSFNDMAYSVRFEHVEYVLPMEWFRLFEDTVHP